MATGTGPAVGTRQCPVVAGLFPLVTGDQVCRDPEQPRAQAAPPRVEPVTLAECHGERLGCDILGWPRPQPGRRIVIDGAEIAVVDLSEHLWITVQPGGECRVADIAVRAGGHRGMHFMSVSH